MWVTAALVHCVATLRPLLGTGTHGLGAGGLVSVGKSTSSSSYVSGMKVYRTALRNPTPTSKTPSVASLWKKHFKLKRPRLPSTWLQERSSRTTRYTQPFMKLRYTTRTMMRRRRSRGAMRCQSSLKKASGLKITREQLQRKELRRPSSEEKLTRRPKRRKRWTN